MKTYIVDGFVTEHVKLSQTLSLLYKSLIMIEEDRVRLYALYQRRIDLLTPLQEELNPNVYQNYVQEMSVELCDIYSEIYELRNMDLDEGKVKRTKARVLEVNAIARNCIKYSHILCTTVYESDDKFGFVQAVLNMELQCASKYSKIVEKDPMDHIENLKNAVKAYERAQKFLDEYKEHKKFTTNEEMGKDLAVQYDLCVEMAQLLP